MRNVTRTLVLGLVLSAAPVAAEPLRSGSYFMLRGTDMDPWISAPRGCAAVTSGGPRQASVLFVTKVGGSAGDNIRSGDYVKLRATDGDPWFQVPRGGGAVTCTGPGGASTFVINAEPPEAGSASIQLGTYVRIRGTDQDPWLRVPRGGGPLVGGSHDMASVFFVAAPIEKGDPILGVPSDTPIGPPEGGAQRIELGWTYAPPCSKWNPLPTFAEQRLYAFADVSASAIGADASVLLRECAGEGVAACGLASLISSPAACLPGFKAAMTACIVRRAPGSALQAVSLSVESRCMW